MIFAVEGNVNVGKTTFINHFAKKNKIKIVPETAFKKNLFPIERQNYYISSEIEKNNKYKNTNCIMDRTILSVYLYTLISNEFSIEEKSKIIDNINSSLKQNQILIPNELFFILYPYELINKNHKLLVKDKETQDCLVTYDYYMKYNLFFSNKLKKYNGKIIETDCYRQIVSINEHSLYIDLPKKIINGNEVVLLDGAPAIGKSTIGLRQKKYKYVEEFKYKPYTLHNYVNQINSIILRINCLKDKNDVILDTSFLMGITHLFYSHDEKLTQNEKKAMIIKIMNKVPLYVYISKIIYLYTDNDILEKRKQNDLNKERKHFYDNLKYLDEEINFYEKINKRMGNFSNIYMIEANKKIDDMIEIINKKKSKEVLLVDLFYYILDCIERNDI